MKPTYINYNIHPYPVKLNPGVFYPPYDDIGEFVVSGFNDESLSGTIFGVVFRHDGNGEGFIFSRSVCFPGCKNEDKIAIDNAFQIELKNIHWDTYPIITYDLWVNGIEVETCITTGSTSDSISSIIIFNRNRGRMHIDNIFMADLPYRNTCIVLGEPALPEAMPLPAQPSPTEPTEPVLFIFDLPAFCRGGPGMDYPKLTTYPESTQLEITGQNIEGSWWWSEDGNCWVSDSVGELVGDKTTLDIIIPPHPPDDSDSSDGSPGKPAGCKKSLGQAACIEEGGTWDDQPSQPGTCVCP